MKRSMIARVSPALPMIAALCLLCAASTSRGQSPALATRLPQGANAVMTIDVAKLLQSPLAKQQQLQSKLMSGYADRPLPVPASARHVVIGAAVDPTSLDSRWRVALIDLPKPPRLEPILRAQGGYADSINGKPVAWSRRGIMYDLLAWGQMVTQSYMRAAQELALGQQQATTAAGRIDSPTGYTTDAPNGGSSETADTRAAYKNAQQQRRTAAASERTAAAQRVLDILNPIVATRGKMRADMTQRYGVEF